MIEALIFGGTIFLSVAGIMGGSSFMVYRIERTKVLETEMVEGTKQKAFDAAYLTETNRQTELAIQAASLELPPGQAPNVAKFEWDLK